MNVIAHFGEPYWRSINARTIELSLPERSTVAALLIALFDQYPPLAADLRDGEVRPAIFVDEAEAQPATPLTGGSHIHFVWPVSGG